MIVIIILLHSASDYNSIDASYLVSNNVLCHLIGESVIIDNSVIIASVLEARGAGTHSSFAMV